MKLFSRKNSTPIKGEFDVAQDKSISHRSLIFASLAHGKSRIFNLLEGEDVIKTSHALRSMGVEINKRNDHLEVSGVGIAGLSESTDMLDMGNSGTAARLLAGLVTPYNFTSFFSGDASLRKRPMGRVFDPIKEFGAKIIARQGNLMPFAIIGNKNPTPISYHMKMASAQVKSCILLASLATKGITTIFEPEKCRDHTEIMIKDLGLKIEVTPSGSGNIIKYEGMQDFAAKDFYVPGDISSAAFLMVAALIVEGSTIKIKNVGINPLRTGIITTLQEMGGNIEIANKKEIGGEIVADIVVSHSKLKGVEVPADRAASMIDEYPILSIAAANAKGTTKMHGLSELKVKESNRLLMIQQNLESCGVDAKINGDSLEVMGSSTHTAQVTKIKTAMDHRIAMSFLIMGLTMENGVEIDDSEMIKTSFPNFENIFKPFGISN